MEASQADQPEGEAQRRPEKRKREEATEGDKEDGEDKRGEDAGGDEGRKEGGGEGRKEGGGEDKVTKRQRPEGTKVKQVTFMEPVKDDGDKGPKKEARKRTKKILQQLKSQMDFYFGDSNLSKDRFMKQKIDKDPEGYVPLSVFMNFSKIKEVATSQEMLVKAVKFSTMLQVSEDGAKVRRTSPVKYLTQEETDARTVYVEGFHKFISRDWLEDVFSRCGAVTYISLPRFKATREIKGYAFVEFESPEQAEKAVKLLNCIPDEFEQKPEEKVAGSIKQSKNLTYWKRRATREGLDPSEEEALEKEGGKEEDDTKDGTKTKPKKRKKKNRPSLNQGESTSVDSATAPQTESSSGVPLVEDSKENAAKQSDPSDPKPSAPSDPSDPRAAKAKKPKKKRRRRSSVKPSADDSAGDAEGGAPRAAGTRESAEEDCEEHRRRATLGKEEGQSAAKVLKVDPSLAEEGEELGGEVFEACVASPSDHGGSEDAQSQKVGGRKRKARDSTQQEGETESGASGGRQGEGLDQSRTQECASKKRKLDPETGVQEKPAKGKTEGGEDKPAKGKTEGGEDKPAKGKTEGGEDKPAKGKTEGGEDKPAKGKTEGGEDRPAKGKTEGGEDKPAKGRKEKDTSGQKRSDPGAETGRKRQRKGEDGQRKGEDGGGGRKRRKVEAGSGSEEEGGQGRRKRRHRRHKVTQPLMRLRVMSKQVWSGLKTSYLQQQKVNMKKLKEQLQEAARTRREKEASEQTQEGAGADNRGGRPAPVFVPNVILEVKSEAELCLQSIKADIPPAVQVAYVDIRPGMTEGFIRCQDTHSAATLVRTGLRGLSLSLVEGEAELQYWNKLTTDRQNKLSDGKRKKRRGKLKVLQRAQNPLEESQRQHVIFGEDGTEQVVMDTAQDPDHHRDDFNAYSHRQHTPVWQ